MLQALLDDLADLTDIDILLPLDSRCRDLWLPARTEIVTITADQTLWQCLPELITRCDAMWPVAPESDGLLSRLAESCLAQQKILLLSSPSAINLCADKYATYQCLAAAGIPVVDTALFDTVSALPPLPVVIKPRDGLGCQGATLIDTQLDLVAQSRQYADQNYIIQPYLQGAALSLSALFKNGQAWLLSVNRQQVIIKQKQFILQACQVNIASDYQQVYTRLLAQIAAAIPDLWGYIGIDLLETGRHGLLVLEINPRLTTSYAGIHQATAINPAAQVLALLQHNPDMALSRQRSVNINL